MPVKNVMEGIFLFDVWFNGDARVTFL